MTSIEIVGGIGMKIHNLPAKHMHKANNRGCFHEEKRDKLLSDTVNKGIDESVFHGILSHGFDDFSLGDIGCSTLNVED